MDRHADTRTDGIICDCSPKNTSRIRPAAVGVQHKKAFPPRIMNHSTPKKKTPVTGNPIKRFPILIRLIFFFSKYET